MGNSTTDVNISLEPHLASNLQAIYPLLPIQYAQELAPYITEPVPTTVPYNVLLSLSQWARSDPASKVLKSKGFNPHDYSMIALLAGTVTSPERKFGDYSPPREPEDIEADRIRERKAITVLLNALLSIAGVAFAAWWAGEKTGWSNEVRVLFALFAAIVVAISEAVLYMIWQSRRSDYTVPKSKNQSARHKKVDPVPVPEFNPLVPTQPISDSTNEKAALRQRRWPLKGS